MFSLFNALFYLFFFELVKTINVYNFLFVNVCFIAYVFIVFRVFSQRTFLNRNHVSLLSNEFLEKHWLKKIERFFCSSKFCFSNLCTFSSSLKKFVITLQMCLYNFEACIPSKACRSFHVWFYLSIFYPKKTDLDFFYHQQINIKNKTFIVVIFLVNSKIDNVG